MEPLTQLEVTDLVDNAFPAAPADVKPPTPDEIDAAIVEYESAQRLVKAAQETADGVKQRIIFLVDHFGVLGLQVEQIGVLRPCVAFSASFTHDERQEAVLHGVERGRANAA